MIADDTKWLGHKCPIKGTASLDAVDLMQEPIDICFVVNFQPVEFASLDAEIFSHLFQILHAGLPVSEFVWPE